MISQYTQLWKQPQFNIYYFSLCSVAHIARLFTNAVNPVLSTMLFVVEYGLLSSLINEPVTAPQESWSDIIERHKGDIINVAKHIWPDLNQFDEWLNTGDDEDASDCDEDASDYDEDDISDDDDEESPADKPSLQAMLE